MKIASHLASLEILWPYLHRKHSILDAMIFLFIALMISGSAAGLFDFLTVTTGSSKIVNSPFGISQLFGALTALIIFLYPSIIGVAVYRDYKSEMHTILYSYPFTKGEYLFAKFFSGIFIVHFIVLFIALGIGFGFVLPGQLAIRGSRCPPSQIWPLNPRQSPQDL